MKKLLKVYWSIREWLVSWYVMIDVIKDGTVRDWDENQIGDIYDHRMNQWVKTHVPEKLQA